MNQLKIEGKGLLLAALDYIIESGQIRKDVSDEVLNESELCKSDEIKMIQLLNEYYKTHSPTIDGKTICSIRSQLITDIINLLESE